MTSVGGTQLESRTLADLIANKSREEITCSSETGCVVTTGGGFSWHFPRPEYQAKAVDSYLARAAAAEAAGLTGALTPPLGAASGWFNQSNRGYPDISLVATNFEIFLSGRTSQIGGTSASTPVIGAMVSLWNQQLSLKGKPPMGFISQSRGELGTAAIGQLRTSVG